MFQNITGEFEENEVTKNNIKPILVELLKFQNIIIYILTILVSTISIKQNILSFGLAMLAATLGSGIPIVGVFISGIIRNSFRKWNKCSIRIYCYFNIIFYICACI